MRRSIVLATVLAASTAIFGACEPKAEAPNKPVTTAPSTPASTPATSPSTAPSTSPATTGSPKTTTSPEVKKPETKAPDTKDAKPVANANHK